MAQQLIHSKVGQRSESDLGVGLVLMAVVRGIGQAFRAIGSEVAHGAQIFAAGAEQGGLHRQ